MQSPLQVCAKNDEMHMTREAIAARAPTVWKKLPQGTVYKRTVLIRESLLCPLREYALFVPKGALPKPLAGAAVASGDGWPILFYFHGQGESASQVIASGRFISLPCLVVFCQCRGNPIETPRAKFFSRWDTRFPFQGDDIDYTSTHASIYVCEFYLL
jgi:hypothetical protein